MTDRPRVTECDYRIVIAAVIQRQLTRKEQRQRANVRSHLLPQKETPYDDAYWDGVNTTYREIVDDLEDLLISYRPLEVLANWLKIPDALWDIEDQNARETAIMAFLQERK